MHRIDHRKIRQLSLFEVVVEAGSISRAAAQLGMKAPSLAEQMNELEARLRLVLLKRSPRGVTPTPQGEALLTEIKRFNASAEMLDYSIDEMQKGSRSIVRAGAVYEAMTDILPAIIDRFRKENPKVAFFTKEINSSEAFDMLQNGEIDIAFGRFAAVDTKSYSMLPLRRERPVLLVPSCDPLAGKGGVTFAELSELRFIEVGREVNSLYTENIEDWLMKHGVRPRVVHTVDSINRQIAFAAVRLGAAIVPEGCAKHVPSSVVPLTITGAEELFTLSAAWKKEPAESMSPPAAALIGLLERLRADAS